MKKKDEEWTPEQTLVLLNQYFKMPFGKMHSRGVEVIRIAQLLGRTPGSVSRKLGNFASLDPDHKRRGVGGLPKISKRGRQYWEKYYLNWEALAQDSEPLLEEFKRKQLVANAESAETDSHFDYPQREGTERETLTRIRVNQQFFRKMVLVAYESTCCITGINHDRLLTASHIKPWAKFPDVRVNPYNGLCLNALHDRAFDTGLMTILPDYSIRFSAQLDKLTGEGKWMSSFANKTIKTPERFLPDKSFLEYHNDCIFLG